MTQVITFSACNNSSGALKLVSQIKYIIYKMTIIAHYSLIIFDHEFLLVNGEYMVTPLET